MDMNKILSAIIFFFLCSSEIFSQSFDYGIQFDGIGDNREFFSPYNDAETILGTRLTADLGPRLDSTNFMRFGLSYFYEFGSNMNLHKPQLVLYYGLEKKSLSFKMGAFPRKDNSFYPNALISEKYEYFNPTIDGMLATYKTLKLNLNLILDWVGRQDSIQKEQFMVGFFAKQKYKEFLFEQYGYLFHSNTNLSKTPSPIEDYLGGIFLVGYDFSQKTPFDILKVKTGILESNYKNRGVINKFNIRISSYSEIFMEHKGVGTEVFMKFGYDHNLILGDKFYNNASNYIRFRFYYKLIDYKGVNARFMWSVHIANGDLDNQQQLMLVYKINSL